MTSSIVTKAERSYEFKLLNLTQINETEFRFDVRFRNTSADPQTDWIAIEMMQFQVTFNPDIFNGGAFNNTYLQYVNNTSDLIAPEYSPITPVSSNVTSDQTVIQWVTQPLGTNAYTVMINHNNWIKIGTFKAILKSTSTSGNSKNFASVTPELSLVSSGCLCNWCDVDYDLFGDGGYTRADGAAPNLIPNKTLTDSVINKPFYSHAFTGTGNFNDALRWNNSVHSSDPSNHVPPVLNTNNISIGVLSTANPPSQIIGTCNLTDDRTVNDMTIKVMSKMTVPPLKILSVNGDLYIEVDAGTGLPAK